MKTLSVRQQDILACLTVSSRQTRQLAETVQAPEASVRRDIQSLRAAGHNIKYVAGFATLETTAQ